jgi:acyl carrier protein
MDPKEKALELIAQVCGAERSSLTPETQLVADLGIDSARALHLLVKLEDELEIEIDDDEVAEMQTVGDVLSFLDRHIAAAGE